MLLPKCWLNDFVDVADVADEVIKDKLFSCGFEVEEIIYKNKNVRNVVTCRLTAKERHPDAEKLFVCKVDAGNRGEFTIVTNSKTVSVGDVVPVALDGAVLADGTVIKRGKLRGVESQGMFCGGEELGIGEAYADGASLNEVLKLGGDLPLGEDVLDLLGGRETIFDVSVTANRPDCQSIFGLAREVAAVMKKPLKAPDIDYKTEEKTPTDKKIKVSVLSEELCPRYTAHYISNVRIAPSPKWMQKRLELVGIRSINNMVDITNYVLTEIGQPMHAFDYRELTGGEIVVRRAEAGEKIVTLDEKEFALSPENLVICDKNKPSALAGVMGGKGSGVKEDTQEIVFEAATFKRDNIRKTSRSLGQRSDSSARFEKGVDLYTVELGMNRALRLVSQLECGKISVSGIDVNSSSMEKKTFPVVYSDIDKILGIEVPHSEMKEILLRLGFGVEEENGGLKITVPLYREDVEGTADIAEEIIRLFGYDNIKSELLGGASITVGGRTAAQSRERDIKRRLVDEGFCEIITYSFISPKDYELLGGGADRAIRLFNPLGEDVSLMRTTLIPSMLAAAVRNLNKKNLEGRLFELAKVYLPKSLPLQELPEEKLRLTMCAYGDGEDFFTLKGGVEAVLETAKYAGKISYIPCDKPFMHPTRSAYLMDETHRIVGIIGELHPLTAEKLGIDKRLYIAELDYAAIMESFGAPVYFKGYSKFPTVERDLALVCDKNETNAAVMETIENAGVKILVGAELFDVYTGEGVSEGKKSLAYRLTFSADDRTLSVDEVDAAVKKILKRLESKGITLR